MNERFPSNEKLKSKILIDKLFSEGRSLQNFPIKLLYLPVKDNSLHTHKTGVSAPKRNFKKAVDRNYLKRLMREAFRKNKYLVEDMKTHKYAFMFIYTGRQKLDYNKVFSSISWLLKKVKEKEEAYENKSD